MTAPGDREGLALQRALGRVRGRAARRVIAEADLPTATKALIAEVVRRARLWRGESADTARELASHFEQAADAGVAPAEAARRFGDARQAARLIRRAKRRQRPLAWWAMRRAGQGAGALVALLLVVYAVQAVRYFTGEPRITRDYVAEVVEPARRVPESDRAWPLYREALLAMSDAPWRLPYMYPICFDCERWNRTAAYLRARQGAVALLREAASRPHLGFEHWEPLSDADARVLGLDSYRRQKLAEAEARSPGLLGYVQSRPQVGGELRSAARALWLDAIDAGSVGDGPRAVENLLATIGIARHAQQIVGHFPALTRISIVDGVADTTLEILHRWPSLFSDADLQRLAHALAGAPGMRAADLARDLRLDEAIQLDVVQRWYSEGEGGRLAHAGFGRYLGAARPMGDLGGPVMMTVGGTRRETESLIRRLHADAVELRAIGHMSPAFLLGVDRLDRLAESQSVGISPVFRRLVPTYNVAAVFDLRLAGRVDAALVAIALEAHRRARGSWPATLDELVPEFLPAVPIDRFTGEPLRYALRDGAPLLYSRGADGDDDGGVFPPNPRAPGDDPRTGGYPGPDRSNAVGGDLRLFPPDLTPPEDNPLPVGDDRPLG